MRYDQLLEEMQNQDQEHIRLADNTYAHRINADLITVTLHGHTILTFVSTGTIGVYDAGWPSLTTVRRLNAFTPPRFLFTRHAGVVFALDMTEEDDIKRIPLAVIECLNPDAPRGQGIVINLREEET